MEAGCRSGAVDVDEGIGEELMVWESLSCPIISRKRSGRELIKSVVPRQQPGAESACHPFSGGTGVEDVGHQPELNARVCWLPELLVAIVKASGAFFDEVIVREAYLCRTNHRKGSYSMGLGGHLRFVGHSFFFSNTRHWWARTWSTSTSRSASQVEGFF
jgi:hypothetical protein